MDNNKLAEDVHGQSYPSSTQSGTDLVYNEETGEFTTVPRGTVPSNGEVVTEMTDKGFASDGEIPSSSVIYIIGEEVERFLSSEEEQHAGEALCWEGEGVVHIFLDSPEHSFGEKRTAVFEKKDEATDSDFRVLCSREGVRLYERTGADSYKELEFSIIPKREELYSRSKGILEVDVLKDKRVLIIGLGSFGSQISVELAKAGVGHFVLADFDRVELHNLSRHTASVHDLGRLKTDVVKDQILGKNPYAEVEKLPVNINDDLPLLYDEVGKADLVICATDNNTSRFNISSALVEKQKVGIFGRAITRAEGGDVLRYRQGGPCYCCLVGSVNLHQEEITDVISARKNGRIAAYVSPEDADAMVQVGLSSDIEPICNMMVKLALVELSRGTESGISSLESELTYDFYVWANRRDRHFFNWSPFPGAGAKPTVMRWYGVRVNKKEDCPICGTVHTLDEGGGSEITGLEGISLQE